MPNTDYYKIMGVAHDASAKDIKTAYRRLARKYHPDLNKASTAEAQFKALGEAYETLKDPVKRAAYDASLRTPPPFESSQQGPFSGDTFHYQADAGGFNADWFNSLFGESGRAHTRSNSAGHDRQGTLRIRLEEAYHGVVKTLQVPRVGSMEPAQLKVTVPAGVRTGQSIRLAGLGDPGARGRGDLYLTIEVDKHPLFDVLGKDVYLTLPVTPWEVALGTVIKVPTLGGLVELKIAAGSQGGQTLRLKHRGLPDASPGDQYVLLKVMVPVPKTDADRALYQTMAQQIPFNPRLHWETSHG